MKLTALPRKFESFFVQKHYKSYQNNTLAIFCKVQRLTKSSRKIKTKKNTTDFVYKKQIYKHFRFKLTPIFSKSSAKILGPKQKLIYSDTNKKLNLSEILVEPFGFAYLTKTQKISTKIIAPNNLKRLSSKVQNINQTVTDTYFIRIHQKMCIKSIKALRNLDLQTKKIKSFKLFSKKLKLTYNHLSYIYQYHFAKNRSLFILFLSLFRNIFYVSYNYIYSNYKNKTKKKTLVANVKDNKKLQKQDQKKVCCNNQLLLYRI